MDTASSVYNFVQMAEQPEFSSPISSVFFEWNPKSAYAASRSRCFTTLDILAMNSPLVGFPFSALTVLPK